MDTTKVDKPSVFGGNVNKILGTVKEKAGKVFGNKSMEAKGHMQREMGQTEIEAAKRKKSASKADKSGRGETTYSNPTASSQTTPPSYTNMSNPSTSQPYSQGPLPTESTTATGTTSYDVPPPPSPPNVSSKGNLY